MGELITLIGTDLQRNVTQDMFDAMPPYYADLLESRELVEAESVELRVLHEAIRDVLAQYYVDSATWGLSAWEDFLGVDNDFLDDRGTWDAIETNYWRFYDWNIDDVPNLQAKLSAEERRGNIRAKIRGTGAVTKALLKSVIEAYTNGQVEITVDAAQFLITAKFVGNSGVPSNYLDVKRAVDQIIPAHMRIEFTNEFSQWQQAGAAKWQALNLATWADVKGGLY